MTASIANVMPVSAEDAFKPYPYTFFAGSTDDGAITSTAGNFCVNGNAATNGTFAGNFNVNGTKSEHAGENIPIIFDEIDERFFSGDVEKHSEDYSYSELNINVTVPIEVQGALELDGNITLTTGLKALGDVTLTGEVKNTNESVICSQTGDIFIDSQNVNLGGLVYAPCGTVTLKAQNLNLNNVIILADKIKIDAPSVNANYSTSMGQFVGEAIASKNSGNTGENGGNIADDTTEPMIYAFGSYNEEEKAIDIEWYSNIEGSYEISESADNDVYIPIAEVSDFTAYRYHITDDFDTKYFKVKVTNGEKSAESVPFVVSRTDDGYSVDFLDSDSDGLADIYENIIGTDINDPDTDNDGLTDHTEVYITGTAPTKYDSVTEGVSDFDADNDNDGLSNGTEIELGTDPMDPDTDSDELSDGEEVNTFGTDPLKPDSDGDTLPDGDEPYIGLDPANPKTFETPDEEYVSEQTIAAYSEALAGINTEENPYELTIKYTGTGYAEGSINTGESRYANTVGSDMELGTIAEFSFADTCKMDKAVLYYNIKYGFIDNELKTYSENNDELSGIKRLGVFTFNEEYNILVPVVTEYDIENNTVYAEVDAQGTYFLVDYEKWLKEWGVSAGLGSMTMRFPNVMSTSSTNNTVYDTSRIHRKPHDIVFILQAATNRTDALNSSKKIIENLCKQLYSDYPDLNIYIICHSKKISYLTVNEKSIALKSFDEVKTALSQCQEYYTTSYIDRNNDFMLFRQYFDSSRYHADYIFSFLTGNATVSDLDFLIDYYCKDQNIIYSEIICGQYERPTDRKNIKELIEGYNGLFLSNLKTNDISSVQTQNTIYEFITGHPFQAVSYISSLDLKKITLDEPLKMSSRPDACNSDDDGLTDWEEVDKASGLMTFTPEMKPVLPRYEDYIDIVYTPEKAKEIKKQLIAKYKSTYTMVLNAHVLPLISDPTKGNTDSDDYKDEIDVLPLRFEYVNGLLSLCNIAEEYLPNDFYQSQMLVLQIIRYDCYKSGFWNMISGTIDMDFINYLKNNYPKVYNTFIVKDYHHIYIKDPISDSDDKIDLSHWAATISAFYYDTEYKNVDAIPDYVINSWAGWLGDYYSLLFEIVNRDGIDKLSDYNFVKDKIGAIDYKFSFSDLLADSDAINMYSNNKDFHCSIAIMFNSYYIKVTDNSKRFGSFIKNAMFEDVYINRYQGDDAQKYKKSFMEFMKIKLSDLEYFFFNGALNYKKVDEELVTSLVFSSFVIDNTASAFTDYIFDFITDWNDILYG